MAVSNKGEASVRRDKFSTTLQKAVGGVTSPLNNTPISPVQEKEEMHSTITMDMETENTELQSATINLANKVEERVRKRKPKKHKIGGYITEDLYQKVHHVCDAKDISLSDLFQAVLSEFVESADL